MPKRSSSRPRSTACAVVGCSNISLRMNDSCSPASYADASMSTSVAVLPVEARSEWRIVLKPAAVTVAISPSSSTATVVVCRTIAARSEATYISLSPTPDDQRAAVAGHHDAVGEVGVQHREAVRPDDRAERVADLALQRVGVAAGDEVGEHLGVGVAGQGRRPRR